MRLAVNPVSFTSNNNTNSRSKTEQAATGVGVAGAGTAYASKRGVLAKFGTAGRDLNQLTKEANEALAAANKLNKFGKFGTLFKAKRLKFTADALKLFEKCKNWKVVGKVMNNPVARKLGGAFGSVMAFFVLVPSVINMVNVAGEIKN